MAEQTGYPEDMLELDLDMEADLGIDTVKQAETFLAIRETFDIPRREDLNLRDYNTLEKVIGFVKEMRPDLANEAAAAASDVVGEIVDANVHEQLPGASGPPDDLKQLKGVGPKLATLLNQRGITRFDQIAKLSPGQVQAIDNSLGAFKGRFERDQIVEQAEYLARGDTDGYEVRFGKL